MSLEYKCFVRFLRSSVVVAHECSKMQWNTVFFFCFIFCTASISDAKQQSSGAQRSKVLNVVTIPNPPYTSVLPEGCEGNACFEGYAIDLIKELSKILGFQYRIKLSDDGRYGMQSNGTWHGMIGEVVDGRADLAVADLTITSKRREVVDFSYPFMTTGIGILSKKCVPQVHKLMSSAAVWLYCLISFTIVTVFVIKRRRSSQTKKKLRYEELGGSVGWTTKLLCFSWKLFIFLMVTLSFGTMAMFIAGRQLPFYYPIDSAEELVSQTKVRYGTVASGSTRAFLRNSTVPTYTAISKIMESDLGNFVSSSSEGINRVKHGNYAFFTEAALIEYITERDSDLYQVGGLLNTRAYGIAMKKDSYMKKSMDDAILQLYESGVLLRLKHRWWSIQRFSYLSREPIQVPGFIHVLYAAGFSAEFLLFCVCIEFVSLVWHKFFSRKV